MLVNLLVITENKQKNYVIIGVFKILVLLDMQEVTDSSSVSPTI